MKLKRLLIVVIALFAFIPIFTVKASNTWYPLGSGWGVRLDSPHIGTGAWHMHFYKGKVEQWCVRLDNGQTCDKHNFRSFPPKWVKVDAYNLDKVKDQIRYYNQPEVNDLKKVVPVWILYSIGALLVIISLITLLIPADDAFTAAYWVYILA